LERNKRDIGKVEEVLIEGNTKKSDRQWQGRTDSNKVVIVDEKENLVLKPGDFIKVKIQDCSSASLFGEILCDR
jgi:tRNA-2-methylthio-N6-dimethylallyladenosine synthase